jgi:hypothetical protein
VGERRPYALEPLALHPAREADDGLAAAPPPRPSPRGR